MTENRGHDVYVTLSGAPSAKQRTFHDRVVFDLDEANNIVGVEVLDALSVTIDGEFRGGVE